ncbi:MAG: hypothetical protein ACI4D4_01470 [Lachnospira sp.]
MRQLLKIEFERAFRSKTFGLAISIGLIIVALQIINVVVPASKNILAGFNASVASYPQSVFENWIGMDITHPYRTIYLTIFPLLATLSYGSSYFSDIKTGYIKNLYIRYSMKKIMQAKYVCVFVMGGITVAVPMIVALIVTAAFLPSLIPGNQAIFGVIATNMFNSLFYTHPYIYTFIYLVIYFFYGGAFATIALSVSDIFDYSFIVIIVPFVIYYFLGVIGALYNNTFLGNFRPQTLLSMYQKTGEKEWVFFGMWMLIALITYCVFIKGDKRDVL